MKNATTLFPRRACLSMNAARAVVPIKRKAARLFVFTAALVPLIAGFAPTLRAYTPQATANQRCAAPGTWFAPKTAGPLSGPDVIAAAVKRGIVLLGETHDNVDHHLWQLQTISALHAHNPNMVLAFEAFPRASQPALDKWIQGTVSEKIFLEQSRWFDVWRFDPGLYMDLFHFARQNRVPMIAMNVERDLIRRIGREGFKAIPEKDREGISRPAPASELYLRYLAGVFGEHGSGGPDTSLEKTLADPAFQKFAEAQNTWDRAMAERLASVRRGGGAPLVVGIVGRGHLDYGYGIPHQLGALGIKDTTVLTPWDAARPCGEMKDAKGTPVADAAFALMPQAKRLERARPKLGIMIRALEDGTGVIIDKVVTGSVAEKTGLREGDVIVQAAGQRVSATRTLIAIIQDQALGSWLPLLVRRDGAPREMIAKLPLPGADAPQETP